MNYVFFFVDLQCRLVRAFEGLYPDAKDLKWLLDFPKAGDMLVDGDQWRFVRHGAGLRFERITYKPNWIVDIHKSFNEPRVVDEWRLNQFFESCGELIGKSQVSSLLDEMCLKGHLIEKGNGQYFLKEKGVGLF